jgi:hypothetical protein
MSEAKPDDTSAAEASAWLKNPAVIERRKNLAQELAEEPEWDGPDYEGEECEPCVTLDQLLR